MAKLGTLTLDLIAKIGSFTEPMKKAGDTVQRETKRIESSSAMASSAVMKLGGAIAGVITVGAVIEQADAYTQMAARIRNATNDTTEYNMVQQRLLSTANGTYRALSEAQEVYLSLSGGLKELGYNTKQALDISDSLSYSFVHNATAADKAQSAMSAYGKVLDKGKVDADAWFSIVAAVPNVLDDVAKATGKSSQEVRKLGAEGKLAASDLHLGFLTALESNKALADNMENSLADGMMKVKNNFQVLVGEANSTYGVTAKMADGLGVLADNLELVAQAAGIMAITVGSKTVAEFAKSTTATVTNTVASRNKAIADYDRAKADLAATAAMVKSMGPLNAQTAAMMANARATYQKAAADKAAAVGAGVFATAGRGALALFGGPVGLGLTVAATAASYLLLSGNSKKATESLLANNSTVGDAIAKHKELDQIQRQNQLVAEREKLEELSAAYQSTSSKLVSYTLKVIRHSDMTSEQAIAFSDLVMKYKSGEITLEQLSDALQKSTALSQKQKDEWSKKAAAVRGASNEMNQHKKLVTEITKANTDLKRSHDGVTNAVAQQKTAYEQLNEKQKKVVDDLKQQALRESYINNNMARGWGREKAEFFADKRSEAGVPYTSTMPKTLFLEIEAGYKLQQQTKAREESDKKAEESLKKQLEFKEKNYTYSKSEVEMLKRVAELNAKYDLNGVGAKFGIPNNMLAAVMAQESKGVISAKSPTGAIGPFQTTSIYRKQHNLSISDSYDVKKSAEAAAKYLAASFEIFGNWNDALTTYNAGVKGTKDLLSKGFTGSTAKTKEAKGYAPSIDKWLVGLNGSSNKSSGILANDAVANLKDWSDFQNDLEELRKQALDRQKTVQQSYYSEDQQMAEAHRDRLIEISEAFYGDDAAIKKYTDLENQAYEKSTSEYKQSLVQKTIDERKQLLDVRKNWMTASDYAEQYYALVREEILNTAEYSPEMKDTLIKGANLQQGVEQNEKRESVWSDYKSMMGLDESPYQQDMNLLKAARDEMLITEEEYQRQRLEMQLSYGAQYGADFAGMMMGLVDSSSSAYTVLGLAQKSFALYSVMMDSKVAISKAWASAAFPYNMPAVGMAVMQTGLLEAAVSALSPVGFAGGGFTGFGGKYEPAGIVHKGEGVLNQEEIAALGGPAGFFALRDSIRNGFADGGLALDAPKLMNVQSPAMQDYVNQTQQNASAQLTPQHLQINNILDPSIVGDFMGTTAGTKTFMNFIKNNRTSLKAILA